MKGTIFLKDRKIVMTIGDTGKVPTVTLELLSPQFVFDGDKVMIIEGDVSTQKK